jgi:hypothetical protein
MPIPPNEDMLIEYPAGPASLFAAAARIQGKCTCLEQAGDDPDCPVCNNGESVAKIEEEPC